MNLPVALQDKVAEAVVAAVGAAPEVVAATLAKTVGLEFELWVLVADPTLLPLADEVKLRVFGWY